MSRVQVRIEPERQEGGIFTSNPRAHDLLIIQGGRCRKSSAGNPKYHQLIQGHRKSNEARWNLSIFNQSRHERRGIPISQQEDVRQIQLPNTLSHPSSLQQNDSNRTLRSHRHSPHRLRPVNTLHHTLLYNLLRCLGNQLRGECVLTSLVNCINEEQAVISLERERERVRQFPALNLRGRVGTPQEWLVVLESRCAEDGGD